MNMVTREQITKGVKRYVDSEIVAKMQLSPNSIKRGLIVTGINLWIDYNVESMLGAVSGASALGILDTNGHYDVRKLADEFKKTIPERGYTFNVGIAGFNIGDMTIYGEDVNHLIEYIENA
jgi:hypothetical protein